MKNELRQVLSYNQIISLHPKGKFTLGLQDLMLYIKGLVFSFGINGLSVMTIETKGIV